MSANSWLAEFYPVPASQVPRDRALAHSLRKWIGLLPKALRKHGCYIIHGNVYSKHKITKVLDIVDESCALCWNYRPPHTRAVSCGDCPLNKEGKGRGALIGCFEPWGAWCNRNPRPMIKVLRAAYEAEYQARRQERLVRIDAPPR